MSSDTAAVDESRALAGVQLSVTRWALKGAWAVTDQGLFGLSNFAIHTVLARWVSPESYGAFALAYSVFLLLATVHTALIADPMVVVGSGKYGDRPASYMAVLLRSHWVIAGLTGSVLLAAGFVLRLLGAHALSEALLGVGLSAPFILLLWFMRRTCYMQFDPRLAATGSLTYMVLLALGGSALLLSGQLSVPFAFALMGIASFLSAGVIRLRLPFILESRVPAELGHQVRLDHYVYGRWGIGTGLFVAVTLYLYYTVMPASHGLHRTAELRALTNLVLPALQSIWVLSALSIPRLVKVRATSQFGSLVRRMAIAGVAGSLLYWLVLGLAHEYLIRVLYGGQYVAEAHLLWLLGLLPVVVAGASVVEATLRARERADAVFQGYLLSAVSTLALGMPLMHFYGVAGAMVGLLVSYGVATLSLLWSARSSTSVG